MVILESWCLPVMGCDFLVARTKPHWLNKVQEIWYHRFIFVKFNSISICSVDCYVTICMSRIYHMKSVTNILIQKCVLCAKGARQVQLLLLGPVNIKHLTAQCWPSLSWGWFNKTSTCYGTRGFIGSERIWAKTALSE